MFFTLEELQLPTDEAKKHAVAEKLAAVKKIEELHKSKGRYEFRPMTDGSSGGFVVARSSTPDKCYFVKRFLTEFSGLNNIHYDVMCEFFYYKLLQHMGYGPKCHVTAYSDKGYVLISEDLNQVKLKSNTVKTFQTYSETLKDFDKTHHQPSQKSDDFNTDFMAVEILHDLLELGDVHMNMGNSGTVVTRSPKHDKEKPKVKAKIIDFSLPIKPISVYSAVQFNEILENLSSSWRGLFVEKVTKEELEKKYQLAWQKIFAGSTKRPGIITAIEMAYNDCVQAMPDLPSEKLTSLSKALVEKIHVQKESFSTSNHL